MRLDGLWLVCLSVDHSLEALNASSWDAKQVLLGGLSTFGMRVGVIKLAHQRRWQLGHDGVG